MSTRYIVLPDGETFVEFDNLVVIEVPDEATTEDIEMYVELSKYAEVDEAMAADEKSWRQSGYRVLCRQESLDDLIEGMLEVEADDEYAAEHFAGQESARRE